MDKIAAFVLCGGRGTRLSPVVPHLPKSLAPIAGRPFLDYLLAGLAAAGILDVVLCTGHFGEALEKEYGNDGHCCLRIRYSMEREPLGTAGALKQALRGTQANPFLVLNGDSLLEIDFEALLASHLASGAMVTLALSRATNPRRYGSVVLEANGEIQRFSEKAEAAAKGPGREGEWINAGVYVLDRRVLEEVRSTPPPLSLERDVLPRLTGRGLFGFVTNGFFIDIGVPEEYQRAQTLIPRRSSIACSHSS